VLIDHGRGQQAMKRGNRPARVSIDNFTKLTSTDKTMSIEDALALDRAITRLESIDARQAEIVSLRTSEAFPWTKSPSTSVCRSARWRENGRMCLAEARADAQGRDSRLNAALKRRSTAALQGYDRLAEATIAAGQDRRRVLVRGKHSGEQEFRRDLISAALSNLRD